MGSFGLPRTSPGLRGTFLTMQLEVRPEMRLISFRRLRGGADLYEEEIEMLLRANIEDFTGELLLTVARQPRLGMGGIPDVALDPVRRVPTV